MSTLKDFRFKVDASSLPQRRVRLTSGAKPALETATPPEFRGGTPGMWSSEDLLVAAVASCYVLTLEALMERRELIFRALEVEGVGHVTKRAEGRVGFVVIELRVGLTVDAGFERRAEQTARDAHRVCIVAHALEIPVELELRVRTANQTEPAVAVHGGI